METIMPKYRSLTDVPGAAQYVETSPRHIRLLIQQRRVPYFKVGGKIRFDLADLDAWLDANRIEATGPV
jgi:excisionase family DNA binding protein